MLRALAAPRHRIWPSRISMAPPSGMQTAMRNGKRTQRCAAKPPSRPHPPPAAAGCGITTPRNRLPDAPRAARNISVLPFCGLPLEILVGFGERLTLDRERRPGNELEPRGRDGLG